MKNITPKAMRCPAGYCQSIHKLDDGRLLIVGDRADQRAHDADIGMRPDEQAVIISPDLLADHVAEKVREAIVQCCTVVEEVYKAYAGHRPPLSQVIIFEKYIAAMADLLPPKPLNEREQG